MEVGIEHRKARAGKYEHGFRSADVQVVEKIKPEVPRRSVFLRGPVRRVRDEYPPCGEGITRVDSGNAFAKFVSPPVPLKLNPDLYPAERLPKRLAACDAVKAQNDAMRSPVKSPVLYLMEAFLFAMELACPVIRSGFRASIDSDILRVI